jgi:YidC/Oxa1 family membrane protein insertase
MIQKNPGILIGPITRFLGIVFNCVFNLIHSFSLHHALGISIIIITLVARLLLWPLSARQIKNSVVMQQLQPEIKKIQLQYAGQKDIESQKKLSLEIQKLYADNKINPTGGCLLAFIQLPIFMALNQLLANSYKYIVQIGDIYRQLAENIIKVPNYIALVRPIAIRETPKNMTLNISLVPDLEKVINKFTINDWRNFLSNIDSTHYGVISKIINQKNIVESSFGINLVDICGFKFPGVVIPILSVVTTFLSSYFISKMALVTDANTKSQQRLMLVFVPLMMGFISLSLSAGVGVYWITNSVVQFIQQFFIYSCFMKKNKTRV